MLGAVPTVLQAAPVVVELKAQNWLGCISS